MAKTQLISALQKLKNHWAAGAYDKALKLAASWGRLGEHKEAITRGWAAHSNRRMYTEMGKNPSQLIIHGIAAVADRYDLDLPTLPAVAEAFGFEYTSNLGGYTTGGAA